MVIAQKVQQAVDQKYPHLCPEIMVAFVGLQQAVAVPMVADTVGNARLAAPLLPALAGASFDVQSVWLTPNPCTLMNLQASHALTIVVAP